mmetsp:Transcript_28277/g.50526  ORF Transcript_28277/g.50526 Transcript_28277/m.50526 type:complete len:407 (-) Transcript_28277:61-1281(-)
MASYCRTQGAALTPSSSRLAARRTPAASRSAARRASVVRVEATKTRKAASATLLSLSAAPAAFADTVDDAVTAVTSGVQGAAAAVKSGLGVVQTAGGYVKQAADAAAPVFKSAVDTAAPYAKQAADKVGQVASPFAKSLADKVPQAGQEVGKLLSSQGIDAKPIVSAGSKAVDSVKPAANDFFTWFLSQSLVSQAETVLVAGAFLYLAPPVFTGLTALLQGYKGDLSAAAALNMLTSDKSAVLVDIRRTSEKESSGVPDLPSSASNREIELEYAFTEDRKLRGLLANADAVEAQVTALQIAALRRTKKGSPLILLDKAGNTAKIVAKELAKLGYGKVYVIAGGFDGRGGWVQSKLQTSLAKTVSAATVVTGTFAPSVKATLLPSSSGTVKKLPPRGSAKGLPAPRK